MTVAGSHASFADPPHVPSHLRAGAPRLSVTETQHTSLREARARVRPFLEPVTRCVQAARDADPIGLAAARVAVAVVRLRRDGEGDAVEITPSNLAHGLSACLSGE